LLPHSRSNRARFDMEPAVPLEYGPAYASRWPPFNVVDPSLRPARRPDRPGAIASLRQKMRSSTRCGWSGRVHRLASSGSPGTSIPMIGPATVTPARMCQWPSVRRFGRKTRTRTSCGRTAWLCSTRGASQRAGSNARGAACRSEARRTGRIAIDPARWWGKVGGQDPGSSEVWADPSW